MTSLFSFNKPNVHIEVEATHCGHVKTKMHCDTLNASPQPCSSLDPWPNKWLLSKATAMTSDFHSGSECTPLGPWPSALMELLVALRHTKTLWLPVLSASHLQQWVLLLHGSAAPSIWVQVGAAHLLVARVRLLEIHSLAHFLTARPAVEKKGQQKQNRLSRGSVIRHRIETASMFDRVSTFGQQHKAQTPGESGSEHNKQEAQSTWATIPLAPTVTTAHAVQGSVERGSADSPYGSCPMTLPAGK